MNPIVMISIIAYLVMSTMAVIAVEACQRERRAIYKRHLSR